MDNKYAKMRINNFSCGQTLITLLFFMVISLTIITGAIIVIFINTQIQTKAESSQDAYYVAESGMENALIRLERDPIDYTGETLSIGDGSATITAASQGSNTYIATSSGTVGNFVRKIQILATYVNNVFSVQSWKEVY